LQSIEIESFIQKNKKQDLCQLNTLTREKCFKFIEQIRTGYEQTEIMKSAQDISRYVRSKTNNFDFIFTGQQFGKQIKNLIRDFERFITNLLIIGCRYLQLQRGTREPLDDLLIGITYEVIDRHLPRNELVLLQLLDTCEIQLKSHCDTLLFQTLHITFQFSSNPFALSDRLDRSAKALSHLILPAAHMIQRMWSTIIQLINKIGAKITEEEYKILNIVCKDFVRLIEPSCEIINESDFLHLQLKSNQFQLMSEHIDNLYEILIDKRHGMKIFCENMKSRWNLTLKEILQGFIKCKQFNIQRQLEQNQRSRKKFEYLFDNNNSQQSDEIHLADIENILKSKTIDINLHTNRLNRLRYLQIVYNLIFNGINNLGSNLINTPTQHIHHRILLPLFSIISKLYDDCEKSLLIQPLIDFIQN
ncbi:unnamed protein product, partial [Rotaria sp. Silwood2]